FMVLRGRNVEFHRKAFRIAAVFACVAALLQPLSGDHSAKSVAIRQPAKLAAMEAHFKTEKSASFLIGGIPDEKNKEVNYGIKIPGLLSYLAHGDFKAEVKGLDQIPQENHPPVAITHYAFQIMIGLGTLMSGIAVLYFISLWKKRSWLQSTWLLKLFALATPMGFIAVEAGWTVTEVGRQPWIIYGVMKTRDAVTPMPGIAYSFIIFTGVYLLLAFLVVFMLYRQIKMVDKIYDIPAPSINQN
ncbi:MAG: cytochrome bd quinol oxidase subunit 1 apoprotein, partial [Pedobacter sp.]|nr:cytochrome bd quinol oxidase subunit 1 apoprotein [Pedobacter sp.]